MPLPNTVVSPISGHRWCKENYPLIGGVRLLEVSRVIADYEQREMM